MYPDYRMHLEVFLKENVPNRIRETIIEFFKAHSVEYATNTATDTFLDFRNDDPNKDMLAKIMIGAFELHDNPVLKPYVDKVLFYEKDDLDGEDVFESIDDTRSKIESGYYLNAKHEPDYRMKAEIKLISNTPDYVKKAIVNIFANQKVKCTTNTTDYLEFNHITKSEDRFAGFMNSFFEIYDTKSIVPYIANISFYKKDELEDDDIITSIKQAKEKYKLNELEI